MQKLKNRTGFSLIELLVVISIMAVLTAILLMNLVGARERSQDAQKIQNMTQLKNALRMYYNDNQYYPGKISDISSNYMSDVADLVNIVTYNTTPSGDGFSGVVTLTNSAGTNGNDSQKACGVLIPTPGVYMVCSN